MTLVPIGTLRASINLGNEPRFMEIRQAMATPHRGAIGELPAFVDDAIASCWVAERTQKRS